MTIRMKMRMNVCMAGAALLFCVVASGCANNRDLFAKTSIATRSDVFTEVVNSDAHTGKAIIDFSFAVKRNSYYLMGMYVKHTAPPYRLHLNVDGQTVAFEAEPVLEDKSPIDPNVPDSGIGWKYQFSKRIALTPGKHNLTIALPVDDVIVKREIELLAGLNTVELLPVYGKRSLRPYNGQNFTAGVKTLEVTVQ